MGGCPVFAIPLAVNAAWQSPYTVDDVLLILGAWGPCS